MLLLNAVVVGGNRADASLRQHLGNIRSGWRLLDAVDIVGRSNNSHPPLVVLCNLEGEPLEAIDFANVIVHDLSRESCILPDFHCVALDNGHLTLRL